jgi:hypothetical protein
VISALPLGFERNAIIKHKVYVASMAVTVEKKNQCEELKTTLNV